MQPYIASSPADLLDRAALTSRSGLEFLQDMLAGKVAMPAISGTMNGTLHAVAAGRASFRAIPEFRHTNPMGTVHGGWYGTLLDSALGCAVMTIVPRGQFYTTLEYKVNLIRALPLGVEIEAAATVSHAGRTTAVAEASIRGVADGKLYATGSTTCLIMAT